jgi:hypothetical protein
MKKILFLLVIILAFACQREMVPVKSRSATVSLTDVNIGTTANDGTGDALRTAFQKVNANNALIEAAIATTSTTTEVRGIVNDSIDALKELAIPLSSAAWTKADTTYTYKKIITYNQLQAALSGISGGTGSSTTPALQFIVGKTSGAPGNGDSTVYHTDLIDSDILLYRGTDENMSRQYYNATARNSYTGYRISNDTIIVRPAFATDDRVLIEARDMDYSTFGTNSLLTGLMGYWKMDEESGTSMADAHSTNVDGTISAGVTLAQTGVINYAYDFNGTSSNVTLGTECRPTEAISISLWFNTANITTEQQLMGNLYYNVSWCGYRVTITSDGNISFVLGTNTGTVLDKSYSSGKDDGNWHHVVCTWDGSNAYIYVDNVKSTATVMSTDIVYVSGCVLRIGSNSDVSSLFYGGLIDEPCIYNRALSDAEVAILFNETPYDFN